MKKTLLTVILSALFFSVFSQVNYNQVGSLGACGNQAHKNSPPPSPQDGNATLGQVYNKSLCGLNYVSASTKLGQRFSPPGPGQPAPLVISGIPCGGSAVIDKAYLWVGTSGNGVAITASLTDPNGGSHSFPMTQVGTDIDKCWGYAGTFTYRADVTSAITGNGTYLINNIPTGTGNDADGATLVIIYQDPTATWQGTMIIHDGTVVINGGTTTQTINNFNVCQGSTNASGFMVVADLQGLGATMTINNGAPFGVVEDWWNYMQQSTTVTTGQTTAPFNVNSISDCFNFCVMGLYYQTTTCMTCVPTAQTLNIVQNSTPSVCNGANGTASINVSGGSGVYTYTWNPPVSTSNSASSLSPGVYTVVVADTTPCVVGSATIVVGSQSTLASTQQVTNVTCNGGNNGSASVTITGGSPGYTYSWAPSGGTGSSASNLTAGTYTVTVTDASGCVLPILVNVTQPSAAPVVPTAAPTAVNMCENDSVTLTATAVGGNGQYTYSWSNFAGNTQSVNVSPPVTADYVVTVNDGCGNSGTDTVTVVVKPLPIVSMSTNIDVGCAPLCVTFTNNNVPANSTFQWWFSDGGTSTQISPTHCFNDPGIYSFTLAIQDGFGCSDTGTIFNQVFVGGPVASFTGSPSLTELPLGQQVQFTNSSSNSTAWTWNFGDSTTSMTFEPTHTFGDTGTYCVTLVAQDNNGCFDTTFQCFRVVDDYVFIPNVFTPDGDGLNDHFVIKGIMGSGHKLVIYNRWGKIVYETNDYMNTWDGANVEDGVYYYVFTHAKGQVYHGFVHVLRK